MPSFYSILIVFACLIVIALAGYAFYLHLEVLKKQKHDLEKDQAERKLAQENLDNRNNGIITDIRFIAQSLITQQCEITEGVLRIHHLADALDTDIMKQDQFAAIHRHFNDCKDMAIKEAYKNLPKKERFQQDMKRLRLEEENKDRILEESVLIMKYSFSNLKNLH